GPVARAGALEQVAVTRRLLEPSEASRDEAVRLTVDWVDKSLELRQSYRIKRITPPREEAGEALRAIGSGGSVLCAIYLRDADVKGALAALDRVPSGRELARPELVQAIQA